MDTLNKVSLWSNQCLSPKVLSNNEVPVPVVQKLGHFRVSSGPKCKFLALGKNPAYLEKTHAISKFPESNLFIPRSFSL